MDESELDQETEAWMRPKINEGNISAESLEREILKSTSGLPPNFLSILGFLLTHTDTVHARQIVPEKSSYIFVFVGSKDTGLNALFLDGVRHGKWSPVFSHPLLTTKWRVPSLFSRDDDLPIPLRDVVRAAHKEIVAKFEKYRLGGNPSESMKRPAPLWLSVSFVRHGESQSNAGNSQIMDPRLTSRGRYQASEVGQHRQWSDVRIDKLYLSNTTRTRETTECILESRTGAEVETAEKEIFTELDLGAEHKALLMAGRSDEAHSLRTGGGYAVSPTSVRRRHRTPGGESQEDVARRAQLALLHLIFDHGVQLASPPEQASDGSTSWDGTLIDVIPHIVVVSHNLFLSELFESLQCWERPMHVETMEYRNAGWTRHLLRVDWPGDEAEDYDVDSYRGFWFGLRLKNWYKMGL